MRDLIHHGNRGLFDADDDDAEEVDVSLLVDIMSEEPEAGFVPSEMEDLDTHLRRRKIKLKPRLQRMVAAIAEGRAVLMDYIAKNWTGEEDPPKPRIESFEAELCKPEHGTLQACFGISDEQMQQLYKAAQELYALEDKGSDTVAGLRYLNLLNPDVPEFWTALGLAYERERQAEEALDCHKRAIEVDLNRLESYRALVDCCQRTQQQSEGLDFLTAAAALSDAGEKVKELGEELRVA